MKKFSRTKSLARIKAQCKVAGVACDDYNYRELGSDYVAIGVADPFRRADGSPFVRTAFIPGQGYALFNTFNGRFFGRTDKGIEFNSDSIKHEREPWFQALLAFFYE